MAATDARPVPIKNTAYRHYFHYWKTDSTMLTSITGADTQVSKDGAAFGVCTNEFTEIGTSGPGYIDLTSTEMNADSVVIKSTCTNTGAVPYIYYFYPEEAGDIRANAAQLGGTTQTGRDIGASVLLSSGTGTGQLSLSSGLVTLAAVTHTGAVIPTVTTTGTATTVTNGVTVTTNNDKTGYTLATAGNEAIADAVINRNIQGGSNTGRTVRQALAALRNKVVVSGGTMTVYATDDSASEWTASVTTTAGNPITTIDPA
jgi:hypothetical protein